MLGDITPYHRLFGLSPVVASELWSKSTFSINLAANESLIKEWPAARFNDLVGSINVVVGERLLLLLPRRSRQSQASMELNKIWKMKTKVKGFIIEKVEGDYSVAILFWRITVFIIEIGLVFILSDLRLFFIFWIGKKKFYWKMISMRKHNVHDSEQEEKRGKKKQTNTKLY